MKKLILTSTALMALGLAGTAVAATDLAGSDTLFDFTRAVISACGPFNPGINYVGGGSGRGENAMGAAGNPLTQHIAPMSRSLKCSVINANSQCQIEARDGVVVLSRKTVPNPNTFNPTTPDPSCPNCKVQPTSNSALQTLKILYSGSTGKGLTVDTNNPNLGQVVTAVNSCNDADRKTLVSRWSNFVDGNCEDGTCALYHAYRRDDLSGTTDTFRTLIGAASFACTGGLCTTGFCNGISSGNIPSNSPSNPYVNDFDPLRRSCKNSDVQCNIAQNAGAYQIPNMTVGVVVGVLIPTFSTAEAATVYSTKACLTGKFDLAEAYSWKDPSSTTRFFCPETANSLPGFNIAGLCLAPEASDGTFDCISAKNNPNVFFNDLSDDARIFNTVVRTAAGDLFKTTGLANAEASQFWHRVGLGAATCKENNATEQIGCLVSKEDCSDSSGTTAVTTGSCAGGACPTTGYSTGYAGRGALNSGASFAGTVNPIAVSPDGASTTAVCPTDAEILSGDYPLSRNLYVCALNGFGASGSLTSDEQRLAGVSPANVCMRDAAVVTPAARASDFVPLTTAPGVPLKVVTGTPAAGQIACSP